MNDLIKRSDAIKATWQEPSYTDAINALTEVRERIENIPSAENKGEWITDVYKLGKERHRCSECGKGSVEDSNYCSNCGCRMKGADNEVN